MRIQIAPRTRAEQAARARSRISPAALFVNVIARISFGFTPHGGEQVRDAVREHARLAGAGAGDHEQRPLGGEDGLPLGRVQVGEVASRARRRPRRRCYRRRPSGDRRGREERMTGKSAFTDEEWQGLLEAPPLAGMLVLTAEHGGSFRESFALAKAYAEARQQQDQNELLDEIVSVKPQFERKRYGTDDELRDAALQRLRDAAAALESKATPEDAEAYRGFEAASAGESPRRTRRAASVSVRPSSPRWTRSRRRSLQASRRPPAGCSRPGRGRRTSSGLRLPRPSARRCRRRAPSAPRGRRRGRSC